MINLQAIDCFECGAKCGKELKIITICEYSYLEILNQLELANEKIKESLEILKVIDNELENGSKDLARLICKSFLEKYPEVK